MLTIIEAQCTAENVEVNRKNMPIMGQSFTDVDGVLCPSQWQGTLNSVCVPITFWCQRVNKDTGIMAYLCAIHSSVHLLACYYEMLHSTWQYTALVSKNYNEGFI